MICDICGKQFDLGVREDGLPSNINFVADDGIEIIVCTDCLMSIDVRNIYSENPVLEVLKRKRRMVQ